MQQLRLKGEGGKKINKKIKIKQPRERRCLHEVKTQQDNGGKSVREREKSPKAICQNVEVRFKCCRNAYPKVHWLPRFSMLIMCLQIRDEKSKDSKLVGISLVIYVFSRDRNCI